ncbi:cytidine deaminase-like fold-containing protein [Pseudomonas chlororaphis]|uniref:cytidine deaminase-like fold-containing protein n=1 Tax=Pseudomonas chlororaphis TaxID=587753 RepID=UPI004032C6A5
MVAGALGVASLGIPRAKPVVGAGAAGPAGISATSPIAKEGLKNDLLAAQARDSRIGTTLPGAKAPVTVTAESSIGGKTLVDTNQTARPTVIANPNKPTLIADLIPPGKPNSTMANAQAEIGLIQQAFRRGSDARPEYDDSRQR